MAPVLLSSALPPLESTRSPWSCPYPLVFTRAQATAATDQCYRCSTRASVISDLHRFPLSPSQCLVLSLSLPLWLSIYLSCSVPLPLTLALAMLPSAGRDYLIALGWKQWVGGGTEGEREGCRKREMLAGTETPPTPSSRAPNNAGGRETESKRYVAHAFSTYSKEFPLLFPFERLQKKSTRGGNQGKSVYRHSPTCTYTLPHPSSHTSRENG